MSSPVVDAFDAVVGTATLHPQLIVNAAFVRIHSVRSTHVTRRGSSGVTTFSKSLVFSSYFFPPYFSSAEELFIALQENRSLGSELF